MVKSMLYGQILRSRYKIIRALGSGSFGVTYLAEDLDLPDHPLCVVKNLRQSPSQEELQIFINLFDKEAKALYRLGRECSQIPQLFAHFQEGGEFYLVQEYIDGYDLSQEIFPSNKLSEAQVAQLLKEILEVLTIIHDKNIIHRDIKPQNLMRRKSDSKIILIDFGAVKEITALTTNPQEATNKIGTNGYMPYEQSHGYPNLSSDVYAVGMLGIYALTGVRPEELPKDPNSFEVIWRDRVSVSPFLANILDKMVRSNFKERYQKAGEALQALKAASSQPTWLTAPSSEPTLTPPPSSISPPSHFFVANHRFLIGARVVVSLLFGMGLLFMILTLHTADAKTCPPETIKLPSRTKSPNWENKTSKYYGELKNGLPHGCGILIFIDGKGNGNGITYQGRFKEKKYHGQGTLIVNGDKYEGEFNDNMYEGWGKLSYQSGCQYEGKFKNGGPIGKLTCPDNFKMAPKK